MHREPTRLQAEMGMFTWRLILAFTMVSAMVAAGVKEAIERQTLQNVLLLAALDKAHVPVALASVLPHGASPTAEGWTTYAADGRAERIFLYTGSDMFRCARWPLSMRQCLLRVASVLVHEDWHVRHGRSESGAYEAQVVFLLRRGAATEHVKAVRMAGDRVIAAERRATEAARKRYELRGTVAEPESESAAVDPGS
jgi:hypothetical protein